MADGTLPSLDAFRERVSGKWRITAMSAWDKTYVDMVEPAFISFKKPGASELRFGVVIATLDCAYSGTDVGFDFYGSDEGTEISGEGWAELDEFGLLHGEIDFRNGDSTTFKARRWSDGDERTG